MVKKLLLFLFFLCTSLNVGQAQQIELLGLGVNGKTSESLSISDWNSVNEVKAYATSKGFNAIPPSDGVLFDNGSDSDSEWSQISGDQNLSSGSDPSIGVYSRKFSSLTNSVINAVIKSGMEDNIHSFYALIHRNRLELTYTSYSDITPVFMYHNGSANPYTYSIDFEPANESRDIVVRIPVSELDATIRNMIINIKSDDGYLNATFSENTYDQGNSFLLFEYKFENIPGDIDRLDISIYSPDPASDNYNGDSFIVGGVVVDVEKVYDGCTLTQGYWKTHSLCKSGNGNGPRRDSTWDLIPGGYAENTSFFLSKQNYCEVFDTKPGKGGKYYILAYQYIAAQLNLLNNSDPSDIADAYKEATDFLEEHTPQEVKGNRTLEDKAVKLGGILDDFNNGRIGPGHCDDKDDTENEEEIQTVWIKEIRNKPLIYPNPATEAGKIAFKSKENGISSIEMFNIHGQKVGTFFNARTKKGQETEIEYDASKLPKGMYFAVIKNGTYIYKEKIVIGN
ncbi:T9SS type A sorting domain-containing protein [Lutimonas saemankumensis]|uniref:T9SS type A sorting domain-containing protein n=1 Tax=Lutimonas saemankumensis TaxID=483016 RepID=UPI001CD660BC|nr:T9SS type A sorting domain-containing protein [Lutimonas saemankumensis]MCA0931450.1 T9SS type A sorting domain-containing protein [Lutimonas saemankumensis]